MKIRAWPFIAAAATVLPLGGARAGEAAAAKPAPVAVAATTAVAVAVPAPPTVPADTALVLVGPHVRCVLIKPADPRDYYFPETRYRFPNTGGEVHLKRYLEYITGQSVAVVTDAQFEAENARQPFDVRVWVGLQPRVREVLGDDLTRLDDDGFIIRAAGRDVYLAGRNIWGTEWAAYDLLERFAGCRWYAPGPAWYRAREDGVVGLFHIVPRAEAVTMPAEFRLTANPAYKMRWMMCGTMQELRLRYRDKFHHALQAPFLPPAFPVTPPAPDAETARDPVRRATHYADFYGRFYGDVVALEPMPAPADGTILGDADRYAAACAEHYGKYYPEFSRAWIASHLDYYPERGGQRTPPPASHPYDFQPCISNPRVFEVLVRRAGAAFDAGAGSFSVGMNDSDKFCECAACQALVPAELRDRLPLPQQRHAYAFFAFYNRLAQHLSATYPDKRLGCLAYAGLSSLPPGLIQLHPMIVPYLTRDSAQLFDQGEVSEFGDLVARWSRMCARTGIYEYVYGDGFVIPRLYNRYILKNIAARYGVGVDGFYGESDPNWGLDGIKYWQIARMLWEPTLDPAALARDYCDHCFGPASDAMQRYFAWLEEIWCTQEQVGIRSDRSNYRWMNDVRQLGIFTPEKCDQAWALLHEADGVLTRAAAQTLTPAQTEYLGLCRRRFEFYRKTFNVSRTLASLYAAGRTLEPLVEQTELPFAPVAQALGRVFRTATLREVFDEMCSLRETGLVAMSQARTGDYNSFSYHFGRYPGINKAIHRLTAETVAEALKDGERDPAKARQAMADILRRRAGADGPDEPTLQRLTALVQDTGALFVRHSDTAPVVDGAIDPAEWGEPAFSGFFYEAFSLVPAPGRTTVWARADAKRLYLAFDCQGDAAAMGASVQPGDPDPGAMPKKANDDAIAIDFPRPGRTFQALIVNLNGAVSVHGLNPEACAIRVGRTDDAWQAELSLPLQDFSASPQAQDEAPIPIGISRYCRVQRNDPKDATAFATLCTTLMPVADIGGTVGHGNHPHCMTFVWGPRLVYAAPRPAAVKDAGR